MTVPTEVLKRLVYGREITALSLINLTECAALPWAHQSDVVFWDYSLINTHVW